MSADKYPNIFPRQMKAIVKAQLFDQSECPISIFTSEIFTKLSYFPVFIAKSHFFSKNDAVFI